MVYVFRNNSTSRDRVKIWLETPGNTRDNFLYLYGASYEEKVYKKHTSNTDFELS